MTSQTARISWMLPVSIILLFIASSLPTGCEGFSFLRPATNHDEKRGVANGGLRYNIPLKFTICGQTCSDVLSAQEEDLGVLCRREVLAASVAAMMVVPLSASWAAEIPTNRNNSRRLGGLANKIRGISRTMDELQRDLMQERWDLVVGYPPQLRSYVPIFTTYTDAAFPSDLPSDYGLRVALRYEVGRFFASLERFKRAVARKSLDEAYEAFAEMSLHLDRYLRVGGLYTYYDSVIDNEPLFDGYNDALVYSDPVEDPAEVRDLIVLCKGPDKGKTGILIGIYADQTANNCVVKLDKYRGMREIRVVPRSWVAKRLGEQDPDEVFLIPRSSTAGATIRKVED